MHVDVLYLIEHVARELDIGCAIKAMLETDSKISVEIKSIAHDLESTVAQFTPKVVVLPYCNGVFNQPLEKMIPHWPQAKYLSLTFEQVLGKAQLEYVREKDEFSRKYLLYSVWGDFYKQILTQSGVAENHILVNGSPTLNLYRSPYHFFYPQEKTELAQKHNLDSTKRWVFVPENYAWAFYPDKLVRDRIRRGFHPQHAYQYRDFATNSLEQTAAWWCEIGQLEDVVLIVKPRPATPEKDFRARLAEFGLSLPKNLHIIKQGTVREWILASDLVMSSFSTTLLEAAVAQKPIYMLTPIPLPDFLFSEWYQHVEKICNLDEFLAVCSGLNLASNFEDLERWIGKTLFSGTDAILNIAGMIQSVLDHTIPIDSPTEIAEMITHPSVRNIYRKTRKQAWYLYQGIVNAFGYKTAEQKRHAHEKDHLSEDVIASLVKQWQAVLYPSGNYHSTTEVS